MRKALAIRTALFAAVEGLSEFMEKLDPKEARAIIDPA